MTPTDDNLAKAINDAGDVILPAVPHDCRLKEITEMEWGAMRTKLSDIASDLDDHKKKPFNGTTRLVLWLLGILIASGMTFSLWILTNQYAMKGTMERVDANQKTVMSHLKLHEVP